MIASAILIGIGGGCASTTQFVVARDVPAPLAQERRPAVAFTGPPGGSPGAGEALARALVERLRLAGLDPVVVAPEAPPTQGRAIVGAIDALDADAGRVVVRAHVMDLGGQVVMALAPIEVTTSPMPLDDLLAETAARLGAALLPGPAAPTTVEWEDAGEWDAAARARMERGDVHGALAALEAALPRAKAAAVDAETLGALHYDLGLCLDLVGRPVEAERALDEALTLDGTERHIEALQTLRRRGAGGGQ